MIGLVRLEQDLLIERGMLNVCGDDDRVLFSMWKSFHLHRGTHKNSMRPSLP